MSMFFDETISKAFRESDTYLSRVSVYIDGHLFDDTFYGGGRLQLDSSASQVNFDRNSEARSSATFRFLASDEEALQVLSPINGAMIVVQCGIIVEGQPFWQPLGTFRNEEFSFQIGPELINVDARAVDLSEMIRENIWREPFQTGGGTYNEAIEAILDDRSPESIRKLFLYEYTEEECPEVQYMERDNPWTAAYNLARSAMSELYFARNAMLILEEIPNSAEQEPLYYFGGEGFQVETQNRTHSISKRDTYNGVVCVGDAPWLLFPIRGEAWDDNPASETWRGGRMGERPFNMTDATATTDAQCQAIAEKEYEKIAGVTEEISISAYKDPLLKEGSVVLLADRPRQEYYIVDTVTFPLGSSPMSVTAKRKRRQV